MKIFHWLIWFFFASLSANAYAISSCPAGYHGTSYKITNYGSVFGPTAQAACVAYAATPPPWTNPYVTGSDLAGWNCWGTNGSGALAGPKSIDISACEKDAPPPPACPPAGSSAGSTEITFGWKTGPDTGAAWAAGPFNPYQTTYCPGSCLVTGDSSQPPSECYTDQSPSPHGYYQSTCTLEMKHVGSPCTATPDNAPKSGSTEPSAPPPEKNRCPIGTSQIGTDSAGIPICRGDKPDAPSTKQTTTQTTTAPDGTKTTTTTEKTTNSDGSQTTKTTTTTTAPDGTQSTTQGTATGTKPGTSVEGKNDSTDDQKSDLCKQHPTLNICRNSQISGACESVSCDGDAIQCAIARQVAIDACELQKGSDALKGSPGYALGMQLASGTDPRQSDIDTALAGTQVDLSSQSLDQSGFLGGGSCLPDRSISVAGRTVAVSFGAVCNNISGLRYAVLACSLLVAYLLVSKSVLQG
jgi:hypothetical protein